MLRGTRLTLKELIRILSFLLVFFMVFFLSVRFRNVPYINNLFLIPIILSGYFFSTSAAVGLAVLTSFYLFLTSGILDGGKILGLSIQSISLLLAALVSGYFNVIQKSRITNEVIQKKQLQSLNKVTSNFITSLEPAAVYDQFVREVKTLMAVEAAFLASLTKSGELRILAEEGSEELNNPKVISAISQAILRNNQPSGFELKLTGIPEAGSFKTLYIVPVINGEYLILGMKKDRSLTRDELEYLHNFLDEAHFAISGARYYAQKEAQSRFISIIAELNKAAASLGETSEIIDLSLRKMMEITRADCGVFLAVKQNQLTLSALKATGEISEEKLRIAVEKSLSAQAFAELSSILEPRIITSKNPSGAFFKDVLIETGHKNLLYFPIIISDRFSGAMLIFASDFEYEEREILYNIAAELAILFYNTKLLSNMKNLTLKTVESIVNAFDATNPYTRGHSARVAKYATEIARDLGLSFREIREIQFAALLHDMGRIFIDEELLNAPRKLNGEELKIIRRLPEISSKVVQNVDFFTRIIPIIYHHKEHYDGSGYPSGLKGENIPLGSRIIHAAESFVAMTSDRPYRKALNVEEAVKELIGKSGKQFDPAVVESLIRILKKENPSLMFNFTALS